MTAKEKLSKVLEGEFNLEFEDLEVFKNGMSIGTIHETIYIRQGGLFGGRMTILGYSYAIEEIQVLGAMRDFSYGHYDFFSNWKVLSENPLTLFQLENDKITSIKLTAIDRANSKDIQMDITVGSHTIRCTNCRYIY